MIKKTKLSRDVKLMLAFGPFRTIADLFFGTFFIAFIMQTSMNEIISVSMYELFKYITLIVAFFIIASWVKRKNKVIVFGASLIPKIMLLLAIIFLKNDAVNYIIPLGILYGLNIACYWLPMHTMVGEKVAIGSMTRFSGFRSAIGGITKIVSPILLGLFITVGSYTEMAMALLALTLVEFILIFFFRPSMHRVKAPIDFKGFITCASRFPVIRKLLSIEILQGFSISGVLGTVITMYTVYMFKTDLNLGIFTTLFAVFSIITSYLFGRFGKKKLFPKILFASSLSAVLSMILFVVWTSEITFLIYNFVYVTGISLLGQIADINMYNLSKSRCVTRNHKTEYFVLRECALGVGRLVGFGVLLGIGIFGDYSWLRYYLIILTLAILLMGYWSIQINKHIKG